VQEDSIMIRRFLLTLMAGLLIASAASAPAQGGRGSKLSEEELQYINALSDDTTSAVLVHENFASIMQRSAIPIIPSEKGDPMVIPFIRDEAVREQAVTRMNEAYSQGRREEALALARYLVINFPTSEEAGAAQTLIEVLETGGDTGIREISNTGQEPPLPSFVSTNTKMILTSSTGNQVMVGYDILREGDSVPQYGNVVVEEIRTNEVVYKVTNEFMSKTYVVSVNAN
jgi:hypothetical protein